MRRWAATVAALALVACGSGPLELPDVPLDRAATCTAVRTLELRAGKSGDNRLSFAGFTETLHFAMIHAAEDTVQVNQARLDAVEVRSRELLGSLETQDWRSLVEPCNEAFPETQKDAARLPADAFEAGMTCYGIGDFLAHEVAADYPDEQRKLAGIAERAIAAAQPGLQERARGDDREAYRIADGYAARAFKSGRPTSLVGQCGRRFPAER